MQENRLLSLTWPFHTCVPHTQ